ncbi:GNAT family N-acetyltransferase [Winogradskyella litorisediminis]|uniref:GNAT family N-acetyltransferase n=1 Tax=Winogradskyella litorisediminis TaxID=1156618 RepID=A0ABW3N569_9FLAO
MAYYYKLVSEDNIADIQYLIKAVYQQDRDLKIIKKKYDTSAFGHYTIGYIAYSVEDNLPAAYYGVFPCEFTYNNKVYLAAQSGDTMTHPNHRKKGLFVNLAKQTYDRAKELGIEFVFGFPGEASYYGFVKKLEWQHKEDICKFSFLAPCLPYSLIQKIIKPQNYLAWCNFILKPFKSKTYPYSNKGNENPHLLRNDDYYKYKDKNGNYNIKFLGLNVWFQVKGYNFIVADVLSKSSTKPSKIIFKLRVLAFYLGIPRVLFHVSNNSALNKILNQRFTSEKGLAIGYIDLLNTTLPLEQLNFTYSDFDTF